MRLVGIFPQIRQKCQPNALIISAPKSFTVSVIVVFITTNSGVIMPKSLVLGTFTRGDMDCVQ